MGGKKKGFFLINARFPVQKKRRRRISLPKVEKPASDTEDPVFAAFEYGIPHGNKTILIVFFFFFFFLLDRL